MAASCMDDQRLEQRELEGQAGQPTEDQQEQQNKPERSEQPGRQADRPMEDQETQAQQQDKAERSEQPEELADRPMGDQGTQAATEREAVATQATRPVEAATQAVAPAESLTQGNPTEAATQVFAPMEAATQVFAPMEAATQAFAPMEAATQAFAPMEVATQMFAPTEELATQASAPMEIDIPVPSRTEEQPLLEQSDKPDQPANPTGPRELKRPKTAFWLFQEEVRSQVVEEIGSRRADKVAPALAAKWKALNASAKAKYTEKARELMERYQKDLANGGVPAGANKKGNAAAKKAMASTKAKGSTKAKADRRAKTVRLLKSRAGPKKPNCSYSIWLRENRSKVQERLIAEGTAAPGFEDIARAAGKTWSALTDEQKAPYVERARVLAAKFKNINKARKEYTKASAKDQKRRAWAEAKKKAAQARARGKTETPKKEAVKASSSKKGASAAKKTAKPELAADAKGVATPQKRRAAAARPTPGKAKKGPVEKEVYLDMALVAEAEKAGFASTFRRLAERDDMKPYPQRTLLDALVASKGLLHPAKVAVLTTKA